MKRFTLMWISSLLAFNLAACSTGLASTVQTSSAVDSSSNASVASTADVDTGSASAGVVDSAAASSAVDLSDTHEEPGDFTWDAATAAAITLSGSSIQAGSGVTVKGSQAVITAAGTFRISGALADGQIRVDTEDEGPVRLILDGADITNSTSSPIYIVNAGKVIVVLAAGTQNTLADGASYSLEDPESGEPNAALFSAADLTITGSGSLDVTASYNDGIASKDGLIIAGGAITVEAVDDGLRGKDYLVVKDGSLTVAAGGDGLKSDNSEDSSRGFISIAAGTLNITAGGDAIQAETAIQVAGGDFTLTTGGGSTGRVPETTSAKGIEAAGSVTIDGGTFTLNTADDALHSNGSVTINAGTFTIATGDDAAHADETLTVNGGSLLVTASYEGLESAVITINAGEIDITASDDGINVAAGNDGSGTTQAMAPGAMQAPGGMQGPGRGWGPGQDAFATTGNYYLYINGGTITVDARGDGIDVNGAIEMTGGQVLVSGPTEQMNGALDYDRGFAISGGTVAAAGSAGMAMAPDQSSSQASVLVYFSAAQAGGSQVQIKNSAGEVILAFTPARDYQTLAFSSPELESGQKYEIYTGGSLYTSFTVSGTVTSVGSGAGLGNRRP